MGYGIVGFEGSGDVKRPTSSLWGAGWSRPVNGTFFHTDYTNPPGNADGTAAGSVDEMPDHVLDGDAAGNDEVFAFASNILGEGNISVATPADNEVVLARTSTMCEIRTGTAQKVTWECRIALSDISEVNAFVGLTAVANGGLGAALISDTANAMTTTNSFVGFLVKSTGKVDAVHNKAAGTVQTALADVGASLNIPPDFRPGDLADAEFVKLGLEFDGVRVTWLVNGCPVVKVVVDTTNFGTNTANLFTMVLKYLGTNASILQIDFDNGGMGN